MIPKMEILKISLNTILGIFASFFVAVENINVLVALLVGLVTIVYFFFQIRKIKLDIRIKKKFLKEKSERGM